MNLPSGHNAHDTDPHNPQTAVVTVSDRCAAGTAVDTAGPAVASLAAELLGARVAWQGVIPDDSARIADLLKDLCSRHLDLVITTGGTGCGPRDVTPEATRGVIEREVPGLAEAMRIVSAQITPHAWLQRGIAGIRGGTLIINLPGSEKAARENFSAIAGILPHALKLLRGETAHPAADAGRLAGNNKNPG